MQRHRTDPLSLVAGLVLAGAGGMLLADRVDLVVRLRWAWPLLLVVLAFAILAGVVGRRADP